MAFHVMYHNKLSDYSLNDRTLLKMNTLLLHENDTVVNVFEK